MPEVRSKLLLNRTTIVGTEQLCSIAIIGQLQIVSPIRGSSVVLMRRTGRRFGEQHVAIGVRCSSAYLEQYTQHADVPSEL